MTDYRRRPDEFLEEVREISARQSERDESPADKARAEQVQAAGRDARQLVAKLADCVVNAPVGEREEALTLALAAAAGRRGLRSPHGPHHPRPEGVDLTNGPAGHCDVCDTRARRLELIIVQYGPYVFRARFCVRCRRFVPDDVDAGTQAA